MTESAGTGDYTLDTGILTIKGIQWSNSGGSYSQPERVSPEEILRYRAFANALTSATPAAAYAIAGANLLMVYPTPSTADTITIYYVPRPATLSAGSDTPSEVPTEFHTAVEQYALWKLAAMSDDSSSGNGEQYRTAYEGKDGRSGMLARIRKHVYTKGGRPGRARLHPSRRYLRAYQHDNSVYP